MRVEDDVVDLRVVHVRHLPICEPFVAEPGWPCEGGNEPMAHVTVVFAGIA
jgi:hypothetical protein